MLLDEAGAMSWEVRSVENLLGTPVPYAYAVRAGPWLFLTGHEAYDWRAGTVDEAVSGPAGYPLFGHHHKSRREADFIFIRMRRVLGEFGSDFAHAIMLFTISSFRRSALLPSTRHRACRVSSTACRVRRCSTMQWR
jgi:hypothetical protein